MSADTIFALASGAGRAAVAVLRLSGPHARETFSTFCGAEPKPRHAHYVRLRDPESGETLDQAIALFMPGPRSTTGEDCAEFHLHGGRATIAAVQTALARRPGLRGAEPGEFARRAFLNGKMDLAQVEGLGDLIEAQTAFQRRQALRIAEGALGRRIESWRAGLIDALALLAAELDFSDEGDVGAFSRVALARVLEPVISEIAAALKAAPASERLREGFLVFIMGPPNAGKSSLLNYLARRDVAIVSELPGTTRDLIEVELDLQGLPVTLVDTAGLRESIDAAERIGVARATSRAQTADLILWLSEGGREPPPETLGEDARVLRVATKADKIAPAVNARPISTQSGEGVTELCAKIAAYAEQALGDGQTALVIRERHRLALDAALCDLRSALTSEKPLELVCEDLRLASRALESIIGRVDVEQVLDAIFSRLCIGK